MAATPIAAPNKTTQNSFLRIIEPSVFALYIWFIWHLGWRRADTIGHLATYVQTVKRRTNPVPRLTVEYCALRSLRRRSTIPRPGLATYRGPIRSARWVNRSMTHRHP